MRAEPMMTELRNDRHLSVHDLRRRINEGEIDTVVVAFTDMQGRLQGKRMHAVYFANHVLEHGTEGCNYLLAVDIEMNTVDGYAISSWDRGYGDFEFQLDPRTIRLLPHQPGADTPAEGPTRTRRPGQVPGEPQVHRCRDHASRRADRCGGGGHRVTSPGRPGPTGGRRRGNGLSSGSGPSAASEGRGWRRSAATSPPRSQTR